MTWGYYRVVTVDGTGAPMTAELVGIYRGLGGFVEAWKRVSFLRLRVPGHPRPDMFFVGAVAPETLARVQ